LEFDDSGRLGGERPFLRPARDKKAKEVRDLVTKAMNVALKRAKGNGD
jgi:hypothetical protein